MYITLFCSGDVLVPFLRVFLGPLSSNNHPWQDYCDFKLERVEDASKLRLKEWITTKIKPGKSAVLK